jgi:hypothetical protein
MYHVDTYIKNFFRKPRELKKVPGAPEAALAMIIFLALGVLITIRIAIYTD